MIKPKSNVIVVHKKTIEISVGKAIFLRPQDNIARVDIITVEKRMEALYSQVFLGKVMQNTEGNCESLNPKVLSAS